MTKTLFEELRRFHERLIADEDQFLPLRMPESSFMILDIWARYAWSDDFEDQIIIEYFYLWGFIFDPHSRNFTMTKTRSMQLTAPDHFRELLRKLKKR